MKISNLVSVAITILVLLISQTAYSAGPYFSTFNAYWERFIGITAPLSCEHDTNPVTALYLYGIISNLTDEWPNYAETYVSVNAVCLYNGPGAPIGSSNRILELPASCETVGGKPRGRFRCVVSDQNALNALAGQLYKGSYTCPLNERILWFRDSRNDGAISPGNYTEMCGGDYTDSDGDLVPDNFDNCDNIINYSQLDSDRDGYGNACDNCVHHPGSQEDTDGDGVGDLCDSNYQVLPSGPKRREVRKIHKEKLAIPPIEKMDNVPVQNQQSTIKKKVIIKNVR